MGKGVKCKVCGLKDGENSRISFFGLPKTPERRVEWLKRLGVKLEPNKKSFRVCSQHFSPNQLAGRVRLKKNALPRNLRETSQGNGEKRQRRNMEEHNEEMILGIETNSDVFCVPEDEERCAYPSLLCPSELITTTGPDQSSLLHDLRQVLSPLCDLDCRTCENYIHQLSQHIQSKHRSDGVEREEKSSYNQTQPSSSTVDFDLDPLAECDRNDYQIEVKCETFLKELEVPAVPTPVPERNRGRKLKSLVSETVQEQTTKSPKANVRRITIVKKIRTEKVTTKVKKIPEENLKIRQEKLTCTFCQKIFKRSSHLKVHLRTHTGEKPFKCTTCQISFRHLDRLKLHERMVHMGEKPLMCTICNRAFPRAYLLKLHVQKTHSIERPYKCDICTRTFAIQENLATHRKIHGVKSFMCEICSARFVSNHSLRKHTKTHTGEKPFVCDHCGKKLATKRSLNYHINSMHTKEQPSFPCDVCEQKFTDPKQLDLHKIIHTGDKHKVVQCDHCPKYFLKGRHSGLWRHMQSHNAENTFECDQCHKTFRTKPDLKRHSLKHTTGDVEKSEKCKECGKSYDMPYLLRLHIRRVHSKQSKQQEHGNDAMAVINPVLHD